MTLRKISPAIFLAIGVLFLGVALVGGFLSYTSEEGENPPEAGLGVSDRESIKVPKPAPAARHSDPAPVVKKEPISPEELRRQSTRALITRIADTPAVLNEDWRGQYLQHIRTETDLNAFIDEYLTLGEARAAQYARMQQASKKPLPQDPRYFVGKAISALVGKENTERNLAKNVKENMALALYKEQDRVEGLENVDEAFMGTFFKNLLLMYELLEEAEERNDGDPNRWLEEHVHMIEAAVMDRYLRVKLRLDKARQKKEGTGQSIAGALFRTDGLQKTINENLLRLGGLYHLAARREVLDFERRQSFADRAFSLLAMVYQRAKSGEALTVMREINDLQCDYLHRLARVSWKKAQFALASGDFDRANENFFVATNSYLKAITRSVGDKREQFTAELAILRKEIAKSKSSDQGKDSADGAEI